MYLKTKKKNFPFIFEPSSGQILLSNMLKDGLDFTGNLMVSKMVIEHSKKPLQLWNPY